MAHTTTVLKTDALGRVTISKEHREALLDAFDKSGTKGPEFARLHGVNYQTFANWVQKRRRKRGDYPAVKPPVNKTLELTLAEIELPQEAAPQAVEKDAPSAPVEISLPGGLAIRVTGSAAVPLAVELVKALDALRSC